MIGFAIGLLIVSTILVAIAYGIVIFDSRRIEIALGLDLIAFVCSTIAILLLFIEEVV